MTTTFITATTLGVAALLPLAGAWAIRRLYVVFLRQAAASLCGPRLHERAIERIARDLARHNGLMLSAGGFATTVLVVAGSPAVMAAGPALVAIVLTYLLTHRTVESHTVIDSASAALVALLAVAGGNLPLIVIVPVILACTGIS